MQRLQIAFKVVEQWVTTPQGGSKEVAGASGGRDMKTTIKSGEKRRCTGFLLDDLSLLTTTKQH